MYMSFTLESIDFFNTKLELKFWEETMSQLHATAVTISAPNYANATMGLCFYHEINFHNICELNYYLDVTQYFRGNWKGI